MSKNLQFHISFSKSWVLSKRGDDVRPVDWVINALGEKYTVSGTKTRVADCEGVIELSDPAEAEKCINEIRDLIASKYDIAADSDVFSVECSVVEEDNRLSDTAEEKENASAEEEKEEKAAPKKKPAKNREEPAPKHISVESLVGAEEFKDLINELSSVAPALLASDTVDSFTSRSYLVSINDGCGLSTYIELFAEQAEKLGLFTFRSKSRTAEVILEPPDPKYGSEGAFASVMQYYQKHTCGKVISVDISEWMTKLTDKEFRAFLKKLESHTGENILFFRIPFVEKTVMADISGALNDILSVKELSVPPFTNDELMACADDALAKRNFTMDGEVREMLSLRIAAEKSDGRFYGIDTVNKVIREMLYMKQVYDVGHGISDNIIKPEEVAGLADPSHIGAGSGFDNLSKMIGMESIISQVKEIVAQIEASVASSSIEAPCIHMRFVGNPGTGKTTVARILGNILKERGILRNGSFFEHSGRDLCGRFVGETAPKTAAICRDAYGSVLFIDEAYSLFRDEGISTADYGREAIDTLVAEMENHRSDLVVIMAGYPDEMEKLMKSNAGLKSRMPYKIEFPNYTREQLAEIYMSMAAKSFSFDDPFTAAVKDYFNSLSDAVLNAKDFSNARFVRNLFERTWGKAALRCQMNRIPCDTLTVEDFSLAASDKEFHNIMEQKKRRIGFN